MMKKDLRSNDQSQSWSYASQIPLPCIHAKNAGRRTHFGYSTRAPRARFANQLLRSFVGSTGDSDLQKNGDCFAWFYWYRLTLNAEVADIFISPRILLPGSKLPHYSSGRMGDAKLAAL